jgi:hypothetical protein
MSVMKLKVKGKIGTKLRKVTQEGRTSIVRWRSSGRTEVIVKTTHI